MAVNAVVLFHLRSVHQRRSSACRANLLFSFLNRLIHERFSSGRVRFAFFPAVELTGMYPLRVPVSVNLYRYLQRVTI